jgi:heme/copper-type cytochrome/quinol oxidase subunit 4
MLELKKKKRIQMIALLATIWFVISLPLPWLYLTPEEAKPQLFILLQITGIISIPFVVLAVVWTLKPELTT